MMTIQKMKVARNMKNSCHILPLTYSSEMKASTHRVPISLSTGSEISVELVRWSTESLSESTLLMRRFQRIGTLSTLSARYSSRPYISA